MRVNVYLEMKRAVGVSDELISFK